MTINKKIKVLKIDFNKPRLRKLKELTIPLSKRVTLIAGHNGIGKSTILAFLASTFGFTEDNIALYFDGNYDIAINKSYFNENFSRNAEKILYFALTEATYVKENPGAAPIISSSIGSNFFTTRCSFTVRSDYKRARVVPRNNKSEQQIELEAEKPPLVKVGSSSKIPLPTIYLGMKRFSTVGEADEHDVSSTPLTMHDEDKCLLIDFMKKVIVGVELKDSITLESIKSVDKKNAQPGYQDHEAFAISVGQDSLGNIATALASFSKLKRELGEDYPGGLLIIDELDVGFHPHALRRLALALKSTARKLSLQVVATTHSPTLIEAFHPDGGGNDESPDRVVYLLDTARPRISPNQSLSSILNDMSLNVTQNTNEESQNKPVLGVYFEDEQAVRIFNLLYSPAKRGGLGRRLGIKIELIALGIGGSSLVDLPQRDPLFKKTILIPDGDTSIKAKQLAGGNIVKMPCPSNLSGTDRSPENQIRTFLINLATSNQPLFIESLPYLKVDEPTTDKVLSFFFEGGVPNKAPLKRTAAEAWWVKHEALIVSWQIVEAWAKTYPTLISKFIQDFESSVERTSKKL